MTEDFRPRPPTRKELFDIFKNMRIVRAFEKLFDKIPTDLNSILIYLLSNVSSITSNYTTDQDDDTLIIDGSSNSVTVTLGLGFVDGKAQEFKCIDDTFPCKINGNGLLIDGDSEIDIFAYESIKTKFDKVKSTWWII